MTAVHFGLTLLLVSLAVAVWVVTGTITALLERLTSHATDLIDAIAYHRQAQAESVLKHAGLRAADD